MRNTENNCGSHRIAKAKRTKQKTYFSKKRSFFAHFQTLCYELLFLGFGTSVRIHMTTAELTPSTSFQEILKNAFSPCKNIRRRSRVRAVPQRKTHGTAGISAQRSIFLKEALGLISQNFIVFCCFLLVFEFLLHYISLKVFFQLNQLLSFLLSLT